MARRLIGTNSTVPEMRLPLDVNRHTQPIYDLLANGVNTKVTLTKYDGSTVTYELEDDNV